MPRTPQRSPLSAQTTLARVIVPALVERSPRDRPFLIIDGPPGCGRSRALSEVRETFAAIPTAMLTTTHPVPDDESLPQPSGTTFHLARIAGWLALHPDARRYGLTQLDTFLFFLSVSIDHHGAVLTSADLDQIIRGANRNRATSSHDRFATPVDLLALVAQAAGVDVDPAIMHGIIDRYRASARVRSRVAQRLSAMTTIPGGTPKEKLRAFLDADGRTREKAFCEAFLLDVAEFGARRRRRLDRRRIPAPLILIDDVRLDDPVPAATATELAAHARGRLLRHLAELLAAHHDPGEPAWAPIAVVANLHRGGPAETAAGDAPDFGTDPVDVVPKAVTSLAANGSATRSWFHVLRYPEPSRNDIERLQPVNDGIDRYPATLIHWIRLVSGGGIAEIVALHERLLETGVAYGAPAESFVADSTARVDWLESGFASEDGDEAPSSRFIDPGDAALMSRPQEKRPTPEDPTIGADGRRLAPSSTPARRLWSSYRRQSAPRRWTIATALALLIASIPVYAIVNDDSCAGEPDVFKAGEYDECVGVTDGAYVYDPRFRTIFALIKKENDRVAAAGDHVTIAFAAPMTRFDANPNTDNANWTIHQLEGAYLAQLAANHSTVNRPTKLVKLDIVNLGSGASSWEVVARRLIERKDSGVDRLAGVVGLGSSYATTKSFMRRLSENHIPMVTAVTTADNFVDDMDYAFRVAPSNSDEVKVHSAYLMADPTVSTAMLVADANPDDDYSSSLAAAFRTHFQGNGGNISREKTYNSANPGVVTNLRAIVSDVCAERPDVVFFAGRARGDLPDFITKLGDRTCLDFPVRIVTGSDASHFPTEADGERDLELFRLMGDASISVEFPNLAHPNQWKQTVPNDGLDEGHRERFDANMREFVKDYITYFDEEPESLVDGQAIMSFDATMSMITAIHEADPRDLTTGSVNNALLNLNGCSAPTGTLSGLVEFDRNGDVINKTMVIQRVDGEAVPQPIRLVWPDGDPTVLGQDC